MTPINKIMYKRYFMIGILFIYFIINFLVIIRHEPWRDELQSWMIGRDSRSVFEVIVNSRYEGHPRLWYEILFVLSRFSHNFMLMQLFHLCIATISVYFILKYAPFANWTKILLIFSYFLTYEYSVIARNYALGVLGLFLICTFHLQKKILGKLFGIFLLCQSSVFGVIMALAYMLFNLGKTLVEHKTSIISVQLVIISFIIINTALAVWQIQPPTDSGFVVGWTTVYESKHLQAVIGTLWKALIPIPQSIFHFWNTNILDYQSLLMAQLGGALLILSLFLFQRRSIRFLYLLGILGLLGFFYIKYIGYLRHQGHIFIWMIACLWMDRVSSEFVVGWRKIITNICLVGILCTQVYAAFYAVKMDWQYAFSGSKQAADFIINNVSPDCLVVAERHAAVSPVAAYLDKPLFYGVINKWGTYLLWDNSPPLLDQNQIMQKVENMHQQTNKPVVMLLDFVPKNIQLFKEVFQVKESIVGDEIYHIYLRF